jgi:hypothetical protein
MRRQHNHHHYDNMILGLIIMGVWFVVFVILELVKFLKRLF